MRTLFEIFGLCILLILLWFSYDKQYDNGWKANQQLNDQRILNILVRHNLGRSWYTALGSLKEANLLCHVLDEIIYVSAYKNNVVYGKKSCGGDTMFVEGIFTEVFTINVIGEEDNPLVNDRIPKIYTWTDSIITISDSSDSTFWEYNLWPSKKREYIFPKP